MSPSRLSLDVRVTYPGFELAIAHAFALEGITGIFGPSGAGKSTLLRAIAGFEHGVEGRVALDGEAWLDTSRGVRVPPHRRSVGYMFQDGRLFPHRSVRGNLAYANQRAASGSARYGFDELVAALDLFPLLERRIRTLSGGEKQRVALGRTLLTRPRLLLLDEPLAALDLARKAEILPYLREIPRRFGIPMLYVSHSVDEVAHLTDDIVLLEAGRIRERGPTRAMLGHLELEPALGPDAGPASTVSGRLVRHDSMYGLSEVDVAGHGWMLPGLSQLRVGDGVRLRVSAREVELSLHAPEDSTLRNYCRGLVTSVEVEPQSAFGIVCVAVEDSALRARITRAAIHALGLEPGRAVFALVRSAVLSAGR